MSGDLLQQLDYLTLHFTIARRLPNPLEVLSDLPLEVEALTICTSWTLT